MGSVALISVGLSYEQSNIPLDVQRPNTLSIKPINAKEKSEVPKASPLNSKAKSKYNNLHVSIEPKEKPSWVEGIVRPLAKIIWGLEEKQDERVANKEKEPNLIKTEKVLPADENKSTQNTIRDEDKNVFANVAPKQENSNWTAGIPQPHNGTPPKKLTVKEDKSLSGKQIKNATPEASVSFPYSSGPKVFAKKRKKGKEKYWAGSITPPAPGAIVLIKPGDNLWRISRRTYGRGEDYTAIVDANRNQIKDPNMIYEGQVFRLPAKKPE